MAVEARLVEMLTKGKIVVKEKKLKPPLVSICNSFWTRFGALASALPTLKMASSQNNNDKTLRDLLSLLAIHCESRQILLDIVAIYKVKGKKIDKVMKDFDWLPTLMEQLENMANETQMSRAQNASRSSITPNLKPLSPEVAAPLLYLKERLSQLTSEELMEIQKISPNVSNLESQMKLAHSKSLNDRSLILLTMADIFSKACMDSLRGPKWEAFHSLFMQLFAIARSGYWVTLLEDYSLDLLEGKFDESQERAPGDSRPSSSASSHDFLLAVGSGPSHLEIKLLNTGGVFTGYFEENKQVVKAPIHVFYSTKGGSSVAGSLFYCNVNEREEEESCELPLAQLASVTVGKETAVLQSQAASGAPSDACFSLTLYDDTEINLQATSMAERDMWVKGLNSLVSGSGKKVSIMKDGESVQLNHPIQREVRTSLVPSSVISAKPAVDSSSSSPATHHATAFTPTPPAPRAVALKPFYEMKTESGQFYYCERSTGKTQWEKPADYDPVQP